jgi:hypothetical protein
MTHFRAIYTKKYNDFVKNVAKKKTVFEGARTGVPPPPRGLPKREIRRENAPPDVPETAGTFFDFTNHNDRDKMDSSI